MGNRPQCNFSGLGQSSIYNYDYLRHSSGVWNTAIQNVLDRERKSLVNISDLKLQTLNLNVPMKITAKSYILVNVTGQTLDADENKDALRSRGAALAHSTQASVYIFRPDIEIAPKRDVVETVIELGE